MKINHISSSTVSKLNDLMPLSVDAKTILSCETDPEYGHKLIIANASNRKRFDVIDSIFSSKQSIYSRLPLSSANFTNCSADIEDDESKINIFDQFTASSIDRDSVGLFESSVETHASNSDFGERQISHSYIDSPPPAADYKFDGSDCGKSAWADRKTPSTEMHSYGSGVDRGPSLSYENRYLSLSISPPLSRRQEMPVLRGSFVSL